MSRLCIACLLVIFSSGGCASNKPTNAPSPKSAAATSPDGSAAGRIEQRARHEAGVKPTAPKTPIAMPPGVEPDALALRDPADGKAFLSLEQAIAQFVAPADEPALKAVPAAPDPESQAEALKHYAKARSASLDGRMLQAILELQKARELDPSSPEILRELARCYLNENRTAQAVEAYDRLVALEPDNAEALFTLGVAAASRRDFELAISALAKLLNTPAASDESTDRTAIIVANYTLAAGLRELGYDRAFIQAALAAVDLPDDLLSEARDGRLASVYRQRGETWRMIGDAHCRLGEFAPANAAYARASTLPVADPLAMHPRLLYTHLCMGRPWSAQRELLGVLQAQPKLISERDIHLCSYLGQQAPDTALLAQAVSELYRAHPDESSVARAAATLLEPEQANELLKSFVARRPRDLDGVMHLLTWVAQRDVRSAADLAVSLAAEHPDLADAYAERLALTVPQSSGALLAVQALAPSPARSHVEAKLLWKSGGLGEAWAVCAAAREQWPDHRALALQQLQLAAALQENALFDKTLASAPAFSDLPSLVGLSQAHRALGRMQPALDVARRGLELFPDDVDALIEMARAFVALGASLAEQSPQEARTAIDQSIEFAERAIEQAPTRDEPFEVLALIYTHGGVLADTNLYRQTLQRFRQASPQSPLLARLMAQESITQKRYEQAVERLVNLCENNPLDTASLSLAVTAWQQWGKLDAAEKWIDQQMARRPADPALLEQWVRVKLLQSQADVVVKRLQRAIEAQPRDLHALRLMETVYRATNQMDSAMELGEKRLLARPEGIRRELELAALYAGAEYANRAIERLEWVKQHASQASLDELGGALRVVGRLPGEDARRDALNIDLVNMAVTQHPDAPLQVYGSGLRALARMGALDERFDRLANQAATDSHSGAGASLQAADEWRELAQGLVDDGHPAAAARALRARFRSQAPLNDDALAMLAQVALIADAAADAAQHDPANAVNSLDLLRLLDERGKLSPTSSGPDQPTLARGAYEVSIFYTLVGSRRGADLLLRETLRLDSSHAMAMNNLGYAMLEAGEGDEETVRLIEQAHAREPNEPNILDSIGWLRYKQGKFADSPEEPVDGKPSVPGALTFIKDAIRRSPEPSPEVLDHLGDVQWRMGQTQESITAWRRVIQMLEESNFRQSFIQNLQVVQTRGWGLLVLDPRTMYDREYGPILKRVRGKLASVEAGGQPAIAPMFEADLHK